MAKQPFANMPAPGLSGHTRQKQIFFILLIVLSVMSLLAAMFTQYFTANAQTADPESGLVFSNQTVGTQSGTKTATFNNGTGQDMTVGVSVSGDFVITSNGCSGGLAGVDGTSSCGVQVAFKPTSAGAKTGQVTFNYSYDDGIVGSPSPDAIGRANPPGAAKPNAIQTGSSSVSLSGTGVAAPTHTPTVNSCASGIQGYVLIDGQPGAGVGVNLTGQSKGTVTIGDGGFFYFNDLCKGDYQIALDYDHTKYKANDADTRQIKLDGVSGSRNNAFSLSTITSTTAPATTAAPTTEAPTTAPTGTTAAPTTPAVVTTVPAQVPNCAIPGGTVLRVCTATTQQSATHFALVIGVQAGDSPVNLNDTVIVNLPAGVTVNSATSAIGAVTTTSSNTVRWGSFSLNPKQSATLVLSIDAPSGNLNGSSLFVSGSFNRSQAFQQRIPGLPGLTDIFPAAIATSGTGGQGGGVSVPSQAPATGAGQTSNQDTPVVWLVLAAILAGGLGILGLFLTDRGRKPGQDK